MVGYCPICGKPVYFGESPICFAFAYFFCLPLCNANIFPSCFVEFFSLSLSGFLFKLLHPNWKSVNYDNEHNDREAQNDINVKTCI